VLLAGGAISAPAEDEILVANAGLYGPLKFVRSGGGRSVCRADLPLEFPRARASELEGLGGGDEEDLWSADPQQSWAAAMTAAASGDLRGAAPAPVLDEALLEQLRASGWSASLDNRRLQVHLHMPGLFCAVRVEPQEPASLKVSAELVLIHNDVEAPCAEAAMCFAQAANDRLPLVRLAFHEHSAPRAITAEVALCGGSIRRWLPTALQVVEAAVCTCARELRALLSDRELARWVLSAQAVGRVR
jgi:hypothetical protein